MEIWDSVLQSDSSFLVLCSLLTSYSLKDLGFSETTIRGIENEKNNYTVCGENFVSPAGSDDAIPHIFYGDSLFKAYQCTF